MVFSVHATVFFLSTSYLDFTMIEDIIQVPNGQRNILEIGPQGNSHIFCPQK